MVIIPASNGVRMGIDDVHNFEAKFDGQLDLLNDAPIEPDDKRAIKRFLRHLDASGDIQLSTMTNHVNKLRLSAERAGTALTEMDRDAVNDLLFSLNHDHGLSEGTLRNYRKSLRKFFEYRGEEWADDIKIGASPDRTVEPDDLLAQDDIDALFDAAKSARDKALLAVMLDTGLRIGALASLRVGDVTLTERAGLITINDEADSTKDAQGTVPLTWSRSYVANWLDVHPDRRDDAAFIHSLKDDRVDADDDGALTYQHLQRHLKRLADRAGVERDRVSPHTFRKTAISQWIRDGLDEQKIKHRAFWAKDSTQFEVYSGVTDEELNDDILEHYDLAEPDAGGPTLEHCPQCGVGVRDDARFCAGCGAALTRSAAEASDDVTDAVTDDLVDFDDPDRRQIARALTEELMAHPDLLEEAIEDHFGSSS